MARADLLKKLFSSYNNNDRESFLKTAQEIITDERKKNHTLLADELERVLSNNKKGNTYAYSTVRSISSSVNKEEKLVEIMYPSKYFDDIILDSDKAQLLEDIIRQFQNWDILVSNGVSPVSRFLFYGPPGCGKTLCANVLAAEIGIPLMYVRFDALVSSYLGETASNIRRVFEMAANDNFLILFDEFDAIGRSRSDASEHGEIKRVVNTFLQQIDCFKGHSIIIAATNFEKSLDYAIWRRFDDTVRFDLPTDDEKRKIFTMRLQQFNGPLQAFDTLLSSTSEFSHSDVDNICKTIMRKCILEGKHIYTKRDIEQAVERQRRIVSLRKSQY